MGRLSCGVPRNVELGPVRRGQGNHIAARSDRREALKRSATAATICRFPAKGDSSAEGSSLALKVGAFAVAIATRPGRSIPRLAR